MRVLLCVLVLIPLVFCSSIEERFIFGKYDTNYLANELKKALGSDQTEAACESACPGVCVTLGVSFISGLCKPACKQLQKTING